MNVGEFLTVTEFGTRVALKSNGKLILPAITFNNNNADQFKPFIGRTVIGYTLRDKDSDIKLWVI